MKAPEEEKEFRTPGWIPGGVGEAIPLALLRQQQNRDDVQHL